MQTFTHLIVSLSLNITSIGPSQNTIYSQDTQIIIKNYYKKSMRMTKKSINFEDKKMSNLTIKERKSKFNKLSNSLNIKLIKGHKKIFNIW